MAPLSSQLQPSDQAESEGYPMRAGTRKAGEPLCSVLWNFLSGAHAQRQSPLIPFTTSDSGLPPPQGAATHCLHLWKGDTGLRPWERPGHWGAQEGLRCSLADALGQGGLAAEARALLCALLPSSPGLLQADTLQVGWVLAPLWGGREDMNECLGHSPAGCFWAPIQPF